ncbi:MAG: hypothetical protein QM497_05420 [Sulfurimonas sp.]
MKIFISVILILLLVLSLSLGIDESALKLQNESFDRAMIAFGLAKGLNAVISLLQGTELSFTPIGVGLNFSIGEVLDPFNDMVERFSWVMLLSSVSLGVQKLLLLLSAKLFLQVALALSVVLTLAILWIKKLKNELFLSYAFKFFTLVLILRFSAIVFVNLSQLVYVTSLESEYNQASLIVEKTKTKLEDLETKNSNFVKSKKEDDFFDRLNNKYNTLANSMNIKKQLDGLEESIEEASKKIITLITIFVFESVLLPLLYLYLLILSIKFIFRSELKLKMLYNINN